MIDKARSFTRGVLDTSAFIRLRQLSASDLPSEPLITAITLAELSVGPLTTTSETEQAARQAHLQYAEANFEALPFDADAARAFGRVGASLRRSGRKTAARAHDALIASVALSHGLPVFTCNPQDFIGIDELTVVALPVSRAATRTETSAPGPVRPSRQPSRRRRTRR